MLNRRPALRDSVLVLEGERDELHFLLTTRAVRKTFTVDEMTRRLVPLLDGTRTVPQLASAVRTAPDASPERVRSVLDLLDTEELLTRPAPEVPSLGSGDSERYARQLGLLEELARDAGIGQSGEALQARLRASSVAVIGAGGLGSWVLVSLAAAGVGRLVYCDADTVELSNLNRQILFGVADVGRSKSEVIAERLTALDPAIVVVPHERIVAGPDDVAALAEGADLVINCADRPSVAVTSDWVAEACLPRGISHIVGGAYAYHLGSLGLTVLPGLSPCWECARAAVGRNGGAALRGRQSAGPSLAMFSAVTANLIAWDALRVLLGLPPATAGRLGELDLATFALRWREIPGPCRHVEFAA